MTTTTAPAGAPQGAGESGTTPPANTTDTSEESLDQRMSRVASEFRTAQSAPAGEDGDSQTDDATSDPAADDGDARPPQAGEGEQPEGDGEPSHVPMAVFKRRLGQVSEKAKALQEQVAARDLDLRRAAATIELLQGERQRLLEAHGKGQPFNAEAEEANALRLTLAANQRAAALQQEHAAAVEEARAAAEREATVSHVRVEMEHALQAAGGLVTLVELRDAMRAAQVYDPPTFVARLLEEKRAAAERLFGAKKPPPPAPRGVKGTGGPGAALRIERDETGMPTNDGLLAIARAHRQSIA